MARESRHVSELIERPAHVVYDYVADPANLPQWAGGLVGAGAPEQVGGAWVVDAPMGRITIEFAPRNDYGVVDHQVTLESGETFSNPMRVIANGDSSELVFTVRRLEGMTDGEFDRDAGLVAADLATVKRILEQR